MKFKSVNKYSVVGFIIGAIISPLIIAGGLYVYIQKQINDLNFGGEAMNFPPPQIPVETKVNIAWKLEALDGTVINLDEEYKDKVVFINFWATWCPPCIAEMPTIERLYQIFKNRIGFACITNESLETIREFKTKKKYSFTLYHIEMEVPDEFEPERIPATFIISRDRKVALKHVGGADWSHERVINFLEKLINKKPEITTVYNESKSGR